MPCKDPWQGWSYMPHPQIINMTSCDNYLKQTNTISDNDEIIILKIDLRRNDTASTQVEYQLYYLFH